MLIKDLKEDYPLVYKAAVENTLKQDPLDWHGSVDLDNPDLEHLESAFDWGSTPQGWAFWYNMDLSRLEQAKAICPELLIN